MERKTDDREGPDVGTFNALLGEGFEAEAVRGGSAQGGFKLLDGESSTTLCSTEGFIGQPKLQ